MLVSGRRSTEHSVQGLESSMVYEQHTPVGTHLERVCAVVSFRLDLCGDSTQSRRVCILPGEEHCFASAPLKIEVLCGQID